MPIKNMNSPLHIFWGAIFEIIDELIAKIKLGKARGRSQEMILPISLRKAHEVGLPTPISPIHNL
ncbi:hypothetical protein N0824_00267 [Microcystis sp. 0824]|nr:hypothetical protein N0824_00267 [Microcystis sp. 0824]